MDDAVDAKKEVEVADVVVARVAMISVRPRSVVRLLRVEVAANAVSKRACVQKRLPDSVRFAVLPKRFVNVPEVAKKLVEVAWVVVALVAMISVRPRRVVRLFNVEVAARFVSKRVSKRPLKVVV